MIKWPLALPLGDSGKIPGTCFDENTTGTPKAVMKVPGRVMA